MDRIEELRAIIGKASVPQFGADAVNAPMIRHWCDAMEDDLPAYTDAAAAGASRHGGLVAPPAMLMAWIMPGLRPKPTRRRPAAGVYDALDEAGFSSVVATNSEQEYDRYLRVGEILGGSETVEDLSDEKHTAPRPPRRSEPPRPEDRKTGRSARSSPFARSTSPRP